MNKQVLPSHISSAKSPHTFFLNHSMSHNITPSTAKKLFKLAHEIRQIEPWKDLHDSDWFAIKDPANGEVQVVAIMGMQEEVFSVQLYRPEEGIRFWNNVITHGEIDPHSIIFQQRMLECEFCDDEDLPDEDIEFYNTHGLKDNQAHAIPVFRKTEPSLYPWFLEEEDAQMLCHALLLTQTYHQNRQAYQRSIFTPTDMHGYPEIPLYSLKKGAASDKATNWGVQKITFPKAPPQKSPGSMPDDLFLNKFHNKKKQLTHWEIASSYISHPSQDDEISPPYYPIITLCVDPNAENPPEPDINHPHLDKASVLRKVFTQAVENYGYLPTELRVATPLALQAFDGITQAYGIKLTQTDSLPSLNGLLKPLLASIEGDLPPELFEALQSKDFDFDSLPEEMKEIVQSLFGNGEDDNREHEELVYCQPKSTSRYILRIDIKGSKPPIWRRLSIPIDATFYDLHYAIQDAFEWDNEHLHQFEMKNGGQRILIQPDEGDCTPFNYLGGGPDILDEFTTPLSQIAQQGIKKFQYTYDFGDNWKHMIKIEKTIETDIPNPLPTILKGAGGTIPEDCGGIYGYYGFLDGSDHLDEIYSAADRKEIRESTFNIDKITFENPRDLIDITPGY